MRWQEVELRDVCSKILSGGTPSTDRSEFWGGVIPWVTSADITSHDLIQPKKFITTNAKANILPRGNVLVVTRVGLGKVAVNDVDLAFSQDVQGLVLKPSVDSRYLVYVLTKKVERFKEVSRGATIKGVTRNDLETIRFPLPPLSVQKQIADTLDRADALRRKDQELFQKCDELAQSIFYEMFGDPFEGSNKFDVSTIGTEVKVKGGKRLPLGESLVKYNTGLPYIKAGNIKNGRVSVKNLEYLLPDTQKKIKNYTVKTGDVCVTIVGVNIGDVGIVPAELDGANLTENAAKLVILDHSRLDPIYLSNYWSMPFVQSLVKKRAMAVGVPKLALFRIEEIDLVVPPIELQKRFNKAVEAVNKQRELVHSQQTYSEYLFNSLLNSSFNTQEVR